MPIDPGCLETTSVSKIKVAEEGKSATFINQRGASYLKVRVDGCAVVGNVAADWLIAQQQIGALVVELKGTDVKHAIAQVVATGKWWKTAGPADQRVAALVVCSQYPKISSVVQRGAITFSKECGGPLTVVSRNKEHKFADLFEP